MPATKPLQDRAEKRAEILAVARRLFVEDGFEATSMAHLARTAGVAANTIYWYFDDKDAVLLAVLDAAVAEWMAGYGEVVSRPLDVKLRWTVEHLLELRKPVSALHAGLARSAALDAWHTTFHERAEALLRTEILQYDRPELDLDAEVRIWVFTLEGLLIHRLPEAEQAAICRQLAARLMETSHRSASSA